ncbi:hypothetical protein F5X99DRAFT_31939 [Biscogniauxia marginata]|nr:hypothetical protein F5X99DRAFT_31939 [Biscogniauxia marginata]
MPYFRGIEVSIIASYEAQKLPEYPHPDGSSVRLMRTGAALEDLRNRDHSSLSSASPGSTDADPTRQKKINPRVSVYIPSLPGEQFWLRYIVNQSPPPSRCIFFKMYMNGRHIVSWGIDTNNRSTGSVTRALYEPGDRWGDAAGGFEMGTVGIETRYFHFMLGLDKKSIAEDGGLIEVQVFRCKGRKRVAAKLDGYRNQERYGIASAASFFSLPTSILWLMHHSSPSGGLVDNPQDATYYDFHLVDAKDSPYATFCFHYRSMKHLEQLNLIPQREFAPPTASMIPRGVPTTYSPEALNVGNPSPSVDRRQFAFGIESLDTDVFDEDMKNTSLAMSEPSEAPKLEECFLGSPPEFSASSSARTLAAEHRNPPREGITAEALQRPLPELPRAQSRRSSVSSLRSNCPSLTPSLRQYVESDDFENEDIRLSTAQPLLIPSESMQALELGSGNNHEGEDASLSDYATSPSSTEASQSPQLPSPEGYIPTTGSVLERHLNQFDSPIAQSSPPRGAIKMELTRSEAALVEDEIQSTTLKLTESEWLRYSPSPLRRRSKRAQRLWSLRSERSAEYLSGKDRETGVKGSQDTEYQDNFSRDGISPNNQVPDGNWI